MLFFAITLFPALPQFPLRKLRLGIDFSGRIE